MMKVSLFSSNCWLLLLAVVVLAFVGMAHASVDGENMATKGFTFNEDGDPANTCSSDADCINGVCSSGKCQCYYNEYEGFWKIGDDSKSCTKCATSITLDKDTIAYYGKNKERLDGGGAQLSADKNFFFRKDSEIDSKYHCRFGIANYDENEFDTSSNEATQYPPLVWDKSLRYFRIPAIVGQRHEYDGKFHEYKISENVWDCKMLMASLTVAIGENSLCEFVDREIWVHVGANSQKGDKGTIDDAKDGESQGASGQVSGTRNIIAFFLHPKSIRDESSSSEYATFAFLSAANPEDPVASFTTSPVIGLCGDIVLDASASSHDSGTQLQYKWTFYKEDGLGDNVKVDDNEFSITTTNAITKIHDIDNTVLKDALTSLVANTTTTYYVHLQVTLLLFSSGDSGAADDTKIGDGVTWKKIERLTTRAPRAEIAGGSVIQGTPSMAFVSGFPVFSQICPDGAPSVDLSKVSNSWSQIGGASVSSVAKTDQEQVLTFPSGFPHQNADYTFTYSISYDGSAVVHANTTVQIRQSPIIARIAGGDQVRKVNSLTFTSASSDPDNNPADAEFQWTCTKDQEGKTPCDQTLSNANTNTATLSSVADGTEVYLHLVYKKDFRNDTDTVKVTFKALEVPEITLSSLPKKISANDTIVVRATVSNAETFAWTITNTNDSSTITDADFVSTGYNKRTLAVKPQKLQESVIYEFKLTSTSSDNVEASSVVRTKVNSKPHDGFCQVSPSNGTAMDTLFTISAPSWIDEDAPLKYTFLYFSKDNPDKKFVIQPRSESSSATTLVPFGGEMSFECVVEDNFGAKASRQQPVSVASASVDKSQGVSSAAELIKDALELKNVFQARTLISNSLTFMEGEAFSERSSLKSTLLTNLLTANGLEFRDASVDSVRQQGEILSSLSAVKTELTSGNQKDVLGILQGIVGAQKDAVDPENVETLGQAFSNMLAGNALKPEKTQTDGLVQAANDLVSALSKKLVEGAGVTKVSTENLDLGSSKQLASDLGNTEIKLGNGEADVKVPTGILDGQSISDTDSVDVKVLIFKDNPYFETDTTASKNISSEIFRLKFDLDDGSTLPIKDLKEGIRFKVPGTFDKSKMEDDLTISGIRPVCKFFDEDKNDWSTDGCEVKDFQTDVFDDHVFCTCKHTTDFGAFMDYAAPQINLPPGATVEINSDNFTTVVVVSTFGGLYVLTMLLLEAVHCCCCIGKAIKNRGKTLEAEIPDKYDRGIIRPTLEKLKKSHIWISVLIPAHDEPGFTRSMRLTVIMIILFGSAGSNALTFGTQQQNYLQALIAGFASDMLVTPFVLGFSFLFMKVKPYNFKKKSKKSIVPVEGTNVELPRIVGFDDIMREKVQPTTSQKSNSSDDLADPTFVQPELAAKAEPKKMQSVEDTVQTLVVKRKRSLTDIVFDAIDVVLKVGHDKFNKITERATWYGLLMLGIVTLGYYLLLAAVCLAVHFTMSWLGTPGVIGVATFGIVAYFAALEILYIQTKIRKFNNTNMKWRSSFETKLQSIVCLLIIAFNILALIGSLFLMSIFSFGPIQFYFVLIADAGFMGFIVLSLIWLFFLLRSPKKKVRKPGKKKKKGFLARPWFPNFFKIPIYIMAWGWLSVMAWLLVLYGVSFDDKWGKGTAWKWLLGSASANAQNIFIKKPLTFLVRTFALVALVHLVEILFLRNATSRASQDGGQTEEA